MSSGTSSRSAANKKSASQTTEPIDLPQGSASGVIRQPDGSKLYTEDAVRQVLRQERRKKARKNSDEVLFYLSILLLGIALGYSMHSMMDGVLASWVGKDA